MKLHTQKRSAGPISRVSARREERGSSLIEVMVSMMILLFVMLGVLQLFTMALAVDRVSTAKNEMMTKAQAVIETIRLANSTTVGTINGQDGGILPLAIGTRSLPTGPLDPNWGYWGPGGMNIVDPDSRFQISYGVEDSGTTWIVTVRAEPSHTGVGYLGSHTRKGVRYAAHIPK